MNSLETDGFVGSSPEPGSAFRDFVGVVRRGVPLAIGIGVLAAGLAFWFSQRLEPIYRANATLLVSDARPTSQFGVTLLTAPVLAPSAYEAATHSVPVLDDAIRRLKDENIEIASRQSLIESTGVEIEIDDPSTILELWADDSDPNTAAQKANALGAALMAWDIQRARTNAEEMIKALEGNLQALDSQLQRALSADAVDQITVESLRDRRADNLVSLETARALRLSAVGYVELLEPALAPAEPRFPSPVRNSVLAFVLGGVLAYVLLLTKLTLDTKFRDPDDVSESVGFEVLAVFQKAPSRHLSREAANFLRANLLSQLTDAHPKVILVTSAQEGEGKTSVAMSLAESIARSDYRTLLIDADLRRPAVGSAYKLPGVRHQRFEDVLKDPRREIKPSVIRTSGTTLHVIAGRPGSAHPSELMAKGFGAALENLRSKFDVVIIDSAPLLPVADSLSILPHVTATLLVVNLARSDRKGVAAAMGLLRRMDSRVPGVVITGASKSTPGGVQYGYGYESRRAASG